MAVVSQAEKVYQTLKQEMLRGHYNLSEIVGIRADVMGLITEQMVADKYEVSRMPAREAMTRLVLDGYLIKQKGKGYMVKSVLPEEQKELAELRFMVECGVVRYLIEHDLTDAVRALRDCYYEVEDVEVSDEENVHFHISLASIAGNSQVTDTVTRLMFLSARPAIYGSIKPIYTLKNKDLYHGELLRCLINRDLDGAIETLRKDVL